MSSMKCSQCGLTNWSTSDACKRCGQPLRSEPEGDNANEFQTPYWQTLPNQKKQPLFNGVVIVIAGLLVVTFVLFFVQQVTHLFNPESANVIGALLGIAGILLYLVTHIWCLIRIFEQSIGWGLASLIVPLAMLAAVGQFWDTTRRSFIGQLFAIGIMAFGLGIGV